MYDKRKSLKGHSGGKCMDRGYVAKWPLLVSGVASDLVLPVLYQGSCMSCLEEHSGEVHNLTVIGI